MLSNRLPPILLLSAFCLVGPLGGVAFAQAQGQDQAQGLGEAIQAADAKYTEAPDVGAVDDSIKIVSGGGEEGLPPIEEEISSGPLRVTLTFVADDSAPANEEPSGELSLEDIPPEAMLPGEAAFDETEWVRPVVTVYFDDPIAKTGEAEPSGQGDRGAPADDGSAEPIGSQVVATLRGPSSGLSSPPVSIQIAQLDPATPYPQVVVSFFTGGAHCCSVTSVVTSNAAGDAWKTVDVGEFDGGPMLATDLLGDGSFVFETRDNAFLYAFACYACSQAPLRVLALRDGAIVDVGAEAQFRPAHAAWLREMIVGVPEQEVNGFLAGYVAQKIRLGEGQDAWNLMLKYYDRNSDTGLDICETDRDETGACPGKTTKLTFPEALKRLLNANGYPLDG